ncbi:MerR family transcriptional regulator [Lactiplantibacillus paraplantarum]|uniref:MerR family transcriptional regulator n=2 Tax=Lactiplantibacillus paraplantarum TaxID=60520 RepID=A0ABQ0NEB1_9LACO|nr:MerR family transcriptional regulator [Lactiplantibacillus paraplantarum]ERL45738.1 transcription regulator [Lactiplantibacillus paraplantarum]KRL50777.1 transcription regulator [Lactiplantibacillus paraplantarum DSM 10667]MCU4684813.1 MerR family transcriptional regulator [Lactiplantibacillus paraplantarum]MDL2063004.1 MerR family transcriptional regulator [Lactiplantibacillus paraplantarum]QJU51226.1 HTH-type transcriptional regulator HmrR [Lactiplantibacillus paraplantarum]
MMQIGEFSRKTDLTIDTLRYYEEVGLIRPTRTTGNRRQYCTADIDWVNFLKRLKKTGISIQHMQRYAQLRYAGNQTIPERLTLLQEQETQLNIIMAETQGNLDFLHRKMILYREIQAKSSSTPNPPKN